MLDFCPRKISLFEKFGSHFLVRIFTFVLSDRLSTMVWVYGADGYLFEERATSEVSVEINSSERLIHDPHDTKVIRILSPACVTRKSSPASF